QIVRYGAEPPKYGYLAFGIARAHQRHRTGMPKYLPETLGALDRRRGGGAFEGGTCNEPVLRQIERQGDELGDFAHRSSRPEYPGSAAFTRPFVVEHVRLYAALIKVGERTRHGRGSFRRPHRSKDILLVQISHP